MKYLARMIQPSDLFLLGGCFFKNCKHVPISSCWKYEGRLRKKAPKNLCFTHSLAFQREWEDHQFNPVPGLATRSVAGGLGLSEVQVNQAERSDNCQQYLVGLVYQQNAPGNNG